MRMEAYECIWVHTDAYGCIRMHIGGKSVHLVAHSPNSSNELRHVFLKSDRSCKNASRIIGPSKTPRKSDKRKELLHKTL